MEVAGSPWKVSSLQAQRNIKSPAFTSPSFFLFSIRSPPFPSSFPYLSRVLKYFLSFLIPIFSITSSSVWPLLPLTAPLDFCEYTFA